VKTPLVIVGAGGHARDVLDVAEACAADGAPLELVGFVVDAQYGAPGTLVNGLPILGGFDWLAAQQGVSVVIAVGDCALKQKLAGRAQAAGARFAEALVHPSAVRTRRLALAEGCVVGMGVTLTSNVRLGPHAQVNNGCTVAHDVSLGAFATVGPGCRLSGNVTLGEGAYVGAGATIVEKRTVGAWSIVGAGAVVVQDVEPNVTVVGVPARVLKRRPAGWQL
jgi:sugar O-acyltransferase (sialic acid O-acetyltransferase NeuD family)